MWHLRPSLLLTRIPSHAAALLGLMLLPLLGGCEHFESDLLAEFHAELVVVEIPHSGAGRSSVTVAINRGDYDGCGPLDEGVVVTVNGTPLEMTIDGQPGFLRDGSWICEDALFSGPVSALAAESGDVTEVKVRDESATITAAFRNAAQPRNLVPRGLTGTVKKGESLIFDWEPQTDQLSDSDTITAYLTPRGGIGSLSMPVRLEGHRITLQVPGEATQGINDLYLDLDGAAKTISCSGVAECYLPVYANYSATITVAQN